MAFFSEDPYRRQQLAMMMAGMAGGMAGTPRMAGWSAPFGGMARGLASMMPYMMQMQADRQAQMQEEQKRQAMQAVYQQIAQALPQESNNPYASAGRAALGNPDTAALGMDLIKWAPKEAEAPKTREVRIGRELVTQEFVNGKWQEVGRGPAWAPPNSTTINMPKPPASIQERDQLVLTSGDPSTPEYAMAYARTFQNPDFVAGTDAQGRPIQTPIYLPVPPNIRKPTYMGEQPAQAPGAAPQAAGPSTGDPLVVGESTVRNSPELRKLEQSFSRVGQSVTRYRQNLKDYGEGPTLKVTDPEKASLLEQGYNDLMLEAKNLYELGVLNGPDYQIMTTTLTPPTSAKAGLIGMPTFLKQLDAFEQKLNDARASAKNIYAPSSAEQEKAAANPWANKSDEEVLQELRNQGIIQ